MDLIKRNTQRKSIVLEIEGEEFSFDFTREQAANFRDQMIELGKKDVNYNLFSEACITHILERVNQSQRSKLEGLLFDPEYFLVPEDEIAGALLEELGKKRISLKRQNQNESQNFKLQTDSSSNTTNTQTLNA